MLDRPPKNISNSSKVLNEAKLVKCTFNVGCGKFLRYLVTYKGIKVNPYQIKSTLEIPMTKRDREVKKLTNKIGS